ncbi:carboxypeptidase-like regulatory domain-containing protein [Hymenobacter chitinivorans]|uniref:Carboxypeptidase family protein n=1 Tax=Hymenobacter chitinivorans DSM 11115 TaxID=1121954 RepID=A0A2M9BRN5_9BACT|nr:carboxypeptidase-like regulatory domain-containing protein [Hymenobacter chitinivorans]PJJ60614.1 hypothetical protein CLV45_2043 [Hymenobacter chitinivorans DSM 11115]
MLFSLRAWAPCLLLFTALATSLGACSKKEDDPAAVVTTGTVEGTISPSGSVLNVTATTPGGLTFLAAPNATTGAFSIPNLAPGAYTLSFGPATGYLPPSSRSITVVAGQTAAAGTVVVPSDGSVKSGTMSWTTDGVAYSTTVLTGQVDAAQNTLYIVGEATTNGVRDQLSLSLYQSFRGPETYYLGGLYESGTLQRATGGIPTATYRTGGSATGTLKITSYSAATGTMSGTFGFSGVDYNGTATRTAAITNGTFTLRF